LKATLVTSNNIDKVTPLFDAYRVFYKQESDINSCKAFLLKLLENKSNHMWMATNDSGEHMGFVNLYPSYSSVNLAPVFILNDLFVDVASRKKGVGSYLLKHAATWAKHNNAIRLHLETGTNNTTAQKLYESLGWLKEKDSYFYYLPL